MSEYINKLKLISALKADAKDGNNHTFISDETAEMIEEFPTENVRENVHGEWITTEINNETWGVCSACGFKQKAGTLNFCPNCGCSMTKEGGT